MTRPDDSDLRERFSRMRRVQRTVAPPFAAVLASRPKRHRVGPVAVLAVALLAATVVLLLARDSNRPAALDTATMLRSARWTAPTDFLLDVPGGWLLRDLPRVAAPAMKPIEKAPTRRTSS